MVYNVREYEQIVYFMFGLPWTGYPVGIMRYDDMPEDVIDAVCLRWLELNDKALQQKRTYKEDREWCAFVRKNYFLRHPRWLYILKNIKSYEPRSWTDTTLDYKERRDAIVECHFKYDLYKGGKYEPTFESWKAYLREASPSFYGLFADGVIVRLPPGSFLSAYIVASSQSGKTELLKILAESIIGTRREALVFIEPAGDASRQIARWHVIGHRLIYVDHALQRGMTPTINPFEISGVPAENTSPEAVAVKKVIAQQIHSALQEVLATGEGSEFTKNMQTILLPCILVLLDYPNATLRDLHRLMDDARNADLLEFARSRAHYPDVADFFTYGWMKGHYHTTKDGIQAKLQDLFSTGIFSELTCGPSTFDLEQALEEKKVIIFNVAKGSLGERESSAFGKLVMAMLQGIAMRRESQGNRVPVRVIIDEVHNFTTKSLQTIITEAAKFKLSIIMAQQQIGQGMSPEMRNAVLNTSAQIAGRNTPSFYSAAASMLHVDQSLIQGLALGEFVVHLAGVRPFKFEIHDAFLGWRNCMNERQWERVKRDQLKRYYRQTTAPAPVKVAKLAGAEDEGVL